MNRKLIALAAALTSACIIQTPPPVPGPPPLPADQTLRVTVRDASTQAPLPDAKLSVIPDFSTTEYACTVDPATARATCVVPNEQAHGDLLASAKDHTPVRLKIDLRVSDQPELYLQTSFVRLPRLTISGQFFGLESGERFTVIEASGFTLYQQFLDGIDIEPVLAQLEELGFNTVRVFGMYNNPVDRGGIGHFVPDEYGERYWSERPAFYQHLAKHRLYGEWVVFADTQAIYPSLDAQRAFASKTLTAFPDVTNALAEWANEADQVINRTDVLSEVDRIYGVLTSRGSNGSQAQPVQPPLDYVTFHTNDASEEQRKVGHNCMETFGGPCETNETSRSTEKGIYRAGNAPELAFDSAAGAALLNAGSCFHSTEGKYGQPLSGLSLAYARAWVAGAKSVPLSCQTGRYRHDQVHIDMENSGGFLRVYQRGDDGSCIARIHR